MEQEETRAIRTSQWLYAARFQGAASFPMQDELYDLTADPLEKTNLSDNAEYGETAARLRSEIDAFFSEFTDPRFDLWTGGRAKSNVTFAPLWQDAWGADWQPL